uniref:Uncharacterized protein n=1 Tax=Nelumbo nucifera TaxID=4432 RepID=A0A822ZVD1_NELNU|nr:TPA_asm: hypothetical protein HUJ06_017232 [Nelumbo nucifera]
MHLGCHDIPHRETPLHLAIRLNDSFTARTLIVIGADVSLHNASEWNPLQEVVCRCSSKIAFSYPSTPPPFRLV